MRSSGSGAGTTVAALPETLAEVDGLLAGLTATARDRVDALPHSELGLCSSPSVRSRPAATP